MIRQVDFYLLAWLSKPQSQSTTMKRSTQILLFLLLVLRQPAGPQQISALSELPFNELLAQKKLLRDGNFTESVPMASALVGKPPEPEISFKTLHKLPREKAIYEEDYEDGKGHVQKQKDEHNLHDILNTSIMVLSYLAFGGYLLCMIVSALREKGQRITTAYPFDGSPNQFAQVLQHYMTQRPAIPFNKFPAVTVHHGGRRRRNRSNQKKSTKGETKKTFISIVDYIEILESN